MGMKWLIFGIILLVIFGTLGYLSLSPKEDLEDSETIASCLEKTEIGKNICLARVAESLQDESVCELIKYKEDGFQDSCYQGVAIAKSDEEICLMIKNNNLENKDQCFSALAIKKNDISICSNIEVIRIKDLCREKVEKFN